MKDPANLVNGIYEVYAPLKPEPLIPDVLFWLVIMLTVLSIISVAIYRCYFSRKQRAIRNIRNIQKQLHSGASHNNDIAYQISRILRDGLSLKQLTTTTSLPLKIKNKSRKWNAYISDLYTYKYSQKNHDGHDINTILDDTLYWLKVWP